MISRTPVVLAVLVVPIAFGGAPLSALKAQPAEPDTVSRSAPPPEGSPPALRLPAIQFRTLPNGLRIALLERHDVPVVSAFVRFDVTPNDPIGKEGLRAAMHRLLNAGTARLSADDLADSTAAMGGTVSPTSFTTLVPLVDRAFALMAEQLLHASFPERELALWKKEQLGNLRHAEEQPEYWANRIFAARLYGVHHRYSRRVSATSVMAITRQDVVALHHTVVRPRNTTVIIAGDLTMDDAAKRVARVFDRWTTIGAPARVIPPLPEPVGTTAIYLYDRPGSAQSVVVVGRLGPRRDAPDYLPMDLTNTVLGGAFHSRLNLDLREEHGYTYGVQSGLETREPPEVGAIEVEAGIATNKTDSAVVRLMQDLSELTTSRTVTDSEMAFAKSNTLKSLPLRFETTAAQVFGVAEVLSYHLPTDYFNSLTAKVASITLAQVRSAAATYIDARHMVIVVVGDRASIEPGLRAAGVGPIIRVDSHGQVLGR